MATASQVLTLCNRALYELEKEPMSDSADFESPSTLAERFFAAQFDAICKGVLSSVDWNCIRMREELTMSAIASSSVYSGEYSYSGSLPGKRIAIWGIQLGTGLWHSKEVREFLIESGILYTNDESVKIKYGWYPLLADYGSESDRQDALGTYIDGWNQSLSDFVTFEIAIRGEPIFVKNREKRAELEEKKKTARGMALSANRREQPQPNAYGLDLCYVGLGYGDPIPG